MNDSTPTPDKIDASSKLGTREQLIRAAVRLMAEQGTDGVSLNEIVRQAGQRNASAMQYHFDNKAGLIQAIFDRYTPIIEARRQQMTDEILGNLNGKPLALTDITPLIVIPLIEQLDSEEGGRDYLRFLANLHNHALDPELRDHRKNKSLEALRALLKSHTQDMPEHIVISRAAIARSLLLHSISDYCRRCDRGSEHDQLQRSDFIATLITAITSIFTAPRQD